MTIEKLLEELYSYSLHSIKLGLGNIEKICCAMGDPQKDYYVIHIAGTNGKGSTSTFVESVLLEDGKRVGKYTSPHILRFNERICACGKEITDEEIAHYFSYVKKIAQELKIAPTFFEVTTAMMFKYFSDKKMTHVILEVGMGGRFDATNVADANIAVITNVSLDHTEFLGKTIYEIALEKAGIIKKDSKVTVGSSEKEFLRAIEEKTKEYTDVNVKYKDSTYKLDFKNFNLIVDVEDKTYISHIFGEHQYKNFLCAYEVLKIVGVDRDIIRKGIAKAFWQCRFEVIKKDKIVILDGAHNADGMRVLCETIKKGYKKSEVVAILSVLKDKDFKELVKILEKCVDKIIFTSINDNPRGQKAITLYENSDKKSKSYSESVKEAYREACQIEGANVVLVCGSFYLLSEFKKEVVLDEF